jgi:Flp pilus assembly protein TadD
MSGLRYPPNGRPKRGSVSGNSPDALHRRGVEAYRQGNYADAVDHFEAAVARRPQMAPWHTALGAALRRAGSLPDAIAAHRRAILLEPGYAPAYNNLGNALKEVGDLAGAESALREACRADPRYAEARLNLALVLRAQQRLAEAEQYCREALQLNPSYLEAKAVLGHLLFQKADFEGAAECFRIVCTAASVDVGNFMNLGAALDALGRFDEADAAYDTVIARAPQLPQGHYALGRRLEQRGEAEGAAKEFRQALATDPEMASAYLSLSALPRYGLTEEERGRMVSLLERTELSDDDRSSLLYALGRVAERERKYDVAFHWMRLANDIDHRRTGFNEIDNLDFINRTAATFDANCWAGLPKGSDCERPVFIIGMPRSGTTLVEQIITSHPAAAGGGELTELPEIANGLARGDGSARLYPECVLDLTATQAAALAERYLARLRQVDHDALRVTDKLPFNFRHLGLITALFPRARIIHCRRDPRDIAVSCYFIKFHRPISFACNLFELGAYLRHYQVLMAHWRRVLPQPMLEIQYEDLVTDPERHVRRIIDFCGLPWDEACLNFYSSERKVRTASVNQVRRPMYVSSIGRWRLYGKHLAPLYAEFEGRLPPHRRGRPAQGG